MLTAVFYCVATRCSFHWPYTHFDKVSLLKPVSFFSFFLFWVVFKRQKSKRKRITLIWPKHVTILLKPFLAHSRFLYFFLYLVTCTDTWYYELFLFSKYLEYIFQTKIYLESLELELENLGKLEIRESLQLFTDDNANWISHTCSNSWNCLDKFQIVLAMPETPWKGFPILNISFQYKHVWYIIWSRDYVYFGHVFTILYLRCIACEHVCTTLYIFVVHYEVSPIQSSTYKFEDIAHKNWTCKHKIRPIIIDE